MKLVPFNILRVVKFDKKWHEREFVMMMMMIMRLKIVSEAQAPDGKITKAHSQLFFKFTLAFSAK